MMCRPRSIARAGLVPGQWRERRSMAARVSHSVSPCVRHRSHRRPGRQRERSPWRSHGLALLGLPRPDSDAALEGYLLAMDVNTELRAFLRTRRARLTPKGVGLPSFGERRRVPGLRREELAQLAGVSFDYYVRLEQGRTRNVSESILDAVARALQLSAAERAHLFNLARPTELRRRSEQAVPVRPGLRRLVETITTTPAFVLDRRSQVLAWNELAAALIADFDAMAPRERNFARFLFLDERARSLYPDWDKAARNSVASLRMAAGRDPDDPALNELVGELSVKSEAFSHLWADHDVRERTYGTKRYHHPIAGEMTIAYEALQLPADPDLTLMLYTVEAGSPSEAAMQRLVRLVESRRRHAGRAVASDQLAADELSAHVPNGVSEDSDPKRT
jgi:transcriptional regulator with XRE-family HTH domain